MYNTENRTEVESSDRAVELKPKLLQEPFQMIRGDTDKVHVHMV